MTILLLRGYNNYFNRIKKSESSISDYKTASTSYLEYANVNFDYQDGILTSLVVGNEQQLEQSDHILDFESGDSPDYLIVHDNNSIKSRWFVVECVKIRGGQYRLALKRDVLVDYNIQIMNSPCYVEKGSINDPNDPLLLNSEGMSFNQIKQNEFSVRDETNCAWLVGYLHKDLDATKLQNINPITYTIPSNTGNIPNAGEYSWEACITYRNLDGTTTQASKNVLNWNKTKSTVKFRTEFQNESWPTYANASLRLAIGLDYSLQQNDVDIWDSDWQSLNSNALLFKDGNQFHWIDAKAAKALGQDIVDHTANWEYVRKQFDALIGNATYAVTQGENVLRVEEDINKYNNTYVVKNNKVYLLTISQGQPKSYEKYYTGEDTIANGYLSSLYFTKNVYGVNYDLTRNTSNPTRKKIKIEFTGQTYSITAQEVIIGETLTYNLPISAYRNECSDALYDMFCMPVDPSVFGLAVEPTDVRFSYRPDASSTFQYPNLNGSFSENQLGIALKLATKLGAGGESSLIYDLQLLPYCPMDNLHITRRSAITNAITINVAFNYLDSKDGTVILNGDGKMSGVIFYPKRANFTKDIEMTIPATHIETQTKVIRNPNFNYSGSVEDGYWWYYSEETFDMGNPVTPLDEMTLEVNIDGYNPDNYAYGGWMVLSGGGLYFGIPYQQGLYPLSWIGFTGTVSLTGDWYVADTAMDKKINNECDFYRLTAPNYNGMFEFKRTKLQDGISAINVDCTYKPISPYIKLNPNLFGSLYSNKDYNDSTGLICSGDYSIPMLSDAMINYELQNRNYQAIFNRQLQNLDVNQRIAKEQQQFTGIVGAITGGVGGAAGGALAGAKAGPYGAIAGAVVGAVGGTAAGVIGYNKDREWLEQQQYEARDYAVDQFQYQLGNIQALPQSVTKSSPLSFNNKVWPILEYYSCTDREKEVLKSKIKYDGMTIMAIGTLNDYSSIGGYLKGKMIRLEDLKDDSHIANAIYEEVEKGFYEGE